MSRLFNKIKDKVRDVTDDLPADLRNLAVSAQYAYNPNHRHDEAHEREEDDKRTAICASHRFQSFAPSRRHNLVKWYIAGHDYFWALSEILDEAKDTIFILDWWLTPELYLRRPPSQHEEWRLDRLLLRKAQQGVKICIIVYKEVTQSMSMSSKHTKHFLEDLHENIAVMRHPDHAGGEIVLYWSHHLKVVVCDNAVACIGGLDICFGRWDTHNAPLCDAHPNDLARQLFPGQDYNDARIADFAQVDHWLSNQADRLTAPRMPWHDVHTMLRGPSVRDISQYFVERWNFVRGLKYRHDSRYHLLAFPHALDVEEESGIVDHPHWERFKEGFTTNRHLFHPPEGNRHGGVKPFPKGHMQVQVLRSAADWSHGILTEHSIQNAYIQLIRESTHYVYIENQFFVSTTGKGHNGIVENLIAQAIVERVISAARSGSKFRVIIVIPAVPGFAGDVKTSGGTLAIMAATYQTISRGPKSIFGMIRTAGFDPTQYIFCYNLRSYDRFPPPQLLRQKEAASGYTWEQVQAALARMYLGDHPQETEAANMQSIVITATKEGESIAQEQTKAQGGVRLNIPSSVAEATEIIHKWEATKVADNISDSISHHALHSQGDILSEPWLGTEEEEKQAFVTEEKYIHSKLLIVDDRTVLVGSANINDRSQLGDRDSEVAIVIEDEEMIESRMNGQRFMANRFAAELRRKLFKLHREQKLLQRLQCIFTGRDNVTNAMQQLGVPQDASPEFDNIVMDPLSDEFLARWQGTARSNAEHFDAVFHCVPSAKVENWSDYTKHVPKPPQKTGHVFSTEMSLAEIKNHLSEIRGTLVEMPLNFLEKEDLLKISGAVNPATMQIYT